MSASPALNLPKSLPVMVLTGSTLFPNSLLPLYIFEPRYREMLASALDSHRMFGLAHLSGPSRWSEDDETDDKISPCMTAGMVRACIGQPDGTSRLMLQGVCRVKILGWEQRKPYRTATIEPMLTLKGDVVEIKQLSKKLLGTVLEILRGAGQQGAALSGQLSGLEDSEVLADLVAANFLQDPSERQRVLEIEDLGARLHFLLRSLGHS